MTADISKLVRLLQLASPTLPVGAYSYSQGLEAAIEARIVTDMASAARWISDVLELSVSRMEAPCLVRLIESWQTENMDSVRHWNEWFLAGRETSELRAESVQMGYSLKRLLVEVGESDAALSDFDDEPSFPALFGFIIVRWNIDTKAALIAYLWAWLENQVMATVKALPLGQTDGQRLLLTLGAKLETAADQAMSLTGDELGSFVPRMAILSCRHETQYSRLFRS